MEVYAARQAIMNRRQHAVAYELLFRNCIENVFPSDVDPNVATSKLVVSQHLTQGFKNLTQGKKALINYSEAGILERMPSLLPAKEVVIEILEDTRPSQAVYEACRDLYRQGYKLALDDFQYQQGWDKFMPFTRLVKFDLQMHTLDEVAPVFNKLKDMPQLKLLAEKVETHEQFMQARKMGFDFFQGYFFCKPEMLKSRDIEADYEVIMAIYGELLRPQLNYDNLTEQFELDVSLTYKLLRFINSGVFNLDQPVSSIKQALIYLGEERARKFIALISTAHIGKGKPVELVRISVIRARFCELIMKTQNELETETAFLLGLFSLIDAILDQPIEDIINDLPLTLEIQEALIGFKNPLFHLLELVKAYEAGSWYLTQKFANVVQVDEDILASLYSQAVNWSSSVEQATQSENT